MGASADGGTAGNLDWETLSRLNPVIGIRVYHGGFCETIRKGNGGPPPGKRKGVEVKEFSRRSRERLARLIFATTYEFRSMMTLTYPQIYPKDGAKVKRDLNRFLVWLRRAHPCEYVWYLEFQKRGAPHIHIMLTIPHQGGKAHNEFAKRWARAQKHDPLEVLWDSRNKRHYDPKERVERNHRREKHWQDVRDADGAKKYALKYALKPYQKQVPKVYRNVGSFWRASRKVSQSVKPIAEISADDDGWRAYLEMTGHPAAKMPFIPTNVYGVKDAEATLTNGKT